jgi:hypothetical protein
MGNLIHLLKNTCLLAWTEWVTGNTTVRGPTCSSSSLLVSAAGCTWRRHHHTSHNHMHRGYTTQWHLQHVSSLPMPRLPRLCLFLLLAAYGGGITVLPTTTCTEAAQHSSTCNMCHHRWRWRWRRPAQLPQPQIDTATYSRSSSCHTSSQAWDFSFEKGSWRRQTQGKMRLWVNVGIPIPYPSSNGQPATHPYPPRITRYGFGEWIRISNGRFNHTTPDT